jgi:hypothetical protein
MKINKTYIVVGAAVALAAFVWYKQRGGISGGAVSNDPQTVFLKLQTKYGTDYARMIEKMYRYETGHFQSGQYVATYSAGMVANGGSFPYGWASLREFVDANPQYNGDYGIKEFNTSRGVKNYVRFPNLESAVFFVAWFIKNKRGGDVGKWNSLDAAESAAYLAELSRVSARFV